MSTTKKAPRGRNVILSILAGAAAIGLLGAVVSHDQETESTAAASTLTTTATTAAYSAVATELVVLSAIYNARCDRIFDEQTIRRLEQSHTKPYPDMSLHYVATQQLFVVNLVDAGVAKNENDGWRIWCAGQKHRIETTSKNLK
jgi:hypothetical protein